MNYYTYSTAIGPLTIGEEAGFIVRISPSHTFPTGTYAETAGIRKAYLQLTEYLEGKRKTFDLPLRFIGTDFQQQVWRALCEIPFGQTCTYKQIAEAIGCPQGSRAVGMANHRNPLMLVVPCHRVIGSNGKMTGYAWGIDMKEWLLKLENSVS